MTIGRLLILVVAFGLMFWFFVLPSIDEPVTRTSVTESRGSASSESDGHESWSKEERAVWRDQVNQRLYPR